MMLLSLLITTRNRKADLLRTLEVMVPRLLPGNEVIVLDDGSSDGTAAAVAERFSEVRLLRHVEGKGLIAARNRLLGEAQGEFAISLDDDAEIVGGGFLSRIPAHFAEN